MAAAYLANDHDAVIETARRMVWLARQKFEFRTGVSGQGMSAGEVSKMTLRLESTQAGLLAVRKSGRVADYKFVTLFETFLWRGSNSCLNPNVF